jgi:hypothetical protein
VRVPPGAWPQLYTCDGTNKRSSNSIDPSRNTGTFEHEKRAPIVIHTSWIGLRNRKRRPELEIMSKIRKKEKKKGYAPVQ